MCVCFYRTKPPPLKTWKKRESDQETGEVSEGETASEVSPGAAEAGRAARTITSSLLPDCS